MKKEDLIEYDLLINSREIFAVGELDSTFFIKLAKNIRVLAQTNSPLTIYLNCSGGYCHDGFGLYDLIKSLPVFVTIVVLGEACSMGSLLLQAADKRIISSNSYLMVHQISMSMSDDRLSNANRIFRMGQEQQERMISIYLERTNLSRKQLLAKMSNDWYLNADEAIELGFADDKL